MPVEKTKANSVRMCGLRGYGYFLTSEILIKQETK